VPKAHNSINAMAPSYEDYTVGWVCALPLELTSAIAMLDEFHEPLLRAPGDENTYVLGRVGKHNVAMGSLPIGEMGNNSAAQVAVHMLRTFSAIKVGLMVGIAGGVPSSQHDIRLGDVVVSKPSDQNGGVFQYDLGKNLPDGFKIIGFLNAPPRVLRSAISTVVALDEIPGHTDRLEEYINPVENTRLPARFGRPNLQPDELFDPNNTHVQNKPTCSDCDRLRLVSRAIRHSHAPVVHYGIVASGNQVIKNAVVRDEIAAKTPVLCFEMEAAGLMNTFPCVVIRGICDYADSHKNKAWQPYAAAAAAAYAKVLLGVISAERIPQVPSAQIQQSSHTITASALDRPEEDIVVSLPQESVDRVPVSTTSAVGSTAPRATPVNDAIYDSGDLGNSLPSSFNVVSQLLLPPKSVKLGRLVVDASAPWEDFCPFELNLTNGDAAIKSHAQLREVIECMKGSKTYALLKKQVSSLLGRQTDVINSVPATRYILLNSGNRFKELCAEAVTRNWLNNTIKYGWNVYMIVGISTVHASVVGADFLKQQHRGLSQVTSPESTTTVQGMLPELIPEDQLVFSIQYRKVTFKWFSTRKVGNAFLEMNSNRWEVPALSGRADMIPTADDAIEATLKEVIGDDDVTDVEEFSLVDDLLM